MPTGYTATLFDGDQDFEDFAMSCARAFGALVTMRDAPADAPIPRAFEPSPYHDQQIALATEQIRLIEAWTPEQAEHNARLMHEGRLAAWRREEETRKARLARYRAMLAKVSAWEPPSEDHKELQAFMADQIEKSADIDCIPLDPPVLRDGETYKRERLAEERRRLESHERGAAEERERVRKRNEWVQALRESLGFEVPALTALSSTGPRPKDPQPTPDAVGPRAKEQHRDG